ncbi:MAG: hemolysin family protein [Candidatus Brocadiia bacterium]
MLLGGTELPALWAVVLLAALVESAVQFLSWSKLEEELEGSAERERYSRYLEHTRAFAALCVVARVVAAVAMVALVARRTLGQPSRAAAALLVACAMLAAAELAGRLVGRHWSAAVLRVALPTLYVLTAPLRLFRSAEAEPIEEPEEPEPEVVEAAKEEIRVAIEDGTTEGALEAEEKQMIEGILKFRQVDVGQIMTPRTEIESLEAGLDVPQAVRELEQFHHSRIPVHEGTLDHVVGIVYVRDLLSAVREANGEGKTLREVMREPFFAPETQGLGRLLQQFQERRVQIAVALDEYGGVSGVVTVEDIMEEIVGEIEDEYDEELPGERLSLRSDGGIEADARVRIDELNEQFDLDIPEDEGYDTVGGFVTAGFARVPEPGEEMTIDGLRVSVLQSDQRRVLRVLLQTEA